MPIPSRLFRLSAEAARDLPDLGLGLGLDANPAAASSGGLRWRIAFGHARRYRRDTLWGDRPRRPRSVLRLLDREGTWEAVGAGDPEPSVGWLAVEGRPVHLLAPPSWGEAIGDRLGWSVVAVGTVETWTASRTAGRSSRAEVRRLGPGDADAFAASTPEWSLRGWASFAQMIRHAAAFGVPLQRGAGFAAVAWVVEQDDFDAAIGVFTWPRYRRLGLGLAVSRALLQTLAEQPNPRAAAWVTSAENTASKGLAAALGLRPAESQPLIRWPAAR